jgi:predicted metal-dependent phosphoesterase TrpH
MRTKLEPLLCELHAHTAWSDGRLTPRELCDLYGRSGFDVLAVTDHSIRGDGCVDAGNFDAYLEDVAAEAVRARELYDLLVIPGLELTYDDPDAAQAAHAVAVGLRSFVGVGNGLEPALRAARAQGAALVAAHPYALDDAATSSRGTGASAASPATWAPLVDRFELFNRDTLFSWVADARLPTVACGDFHDETHLATWKTLLPCARTEAAVVAYLRSTRPAFLVNLGASQAALARAA